MYKIKLSPYSKTFYYEWKINSQSSNYNIVTDQTLSGNISVDRLQSAINKLISEYLLINSHIQQIDGELYWVENDFIEELEYVPNKLSKDKLLEYITSSFNLEQGPLYRFLLVQETKNKYRFITVCHHIIVDGLSTNNIFDNLINYYNDPNYHAKYNLETQVQLISKLNEKLTNLVDTNLTSYKEFWRENLADTQPVNLKFLNTTRKTSQFHVSRIKEIHFEFNQKELKQIKTIASHYVTTPFLFGQIIFAYLLSRYVGQKEFGISYPVAINGGIDFIYGAHINNIIMPYKFDKNDCILDIFRQINKFVKSFKSKNGLNYAHCPVGEIIDVSNPRLLDVGFIQTNLKYKSFKFNEVKNVKINSEFNIDLAQTLLFEQEVSGETINYRVRYNELEVDKTLLENFIVSYKKLFKEVLVDLVMGHIDKQLGAYNILSTEDHQKIVYEYNETGKSFPQNKTIHQLFEEQAVKTPHNIAIVDSGTNKTYSYGQLLLDITYLSKFLYIKANKVKNQYSEQLIGILSEKGYNQVVSALGIMKAGFGYVPLSVDWPIDRINEILKQSKLNLLFISKEQHNNISIKSGLEEYELLVIEDILADIDNSAIQSKQDKITLPNTVPEDIAYVIFTSGSTGKPKGVTISHRGAINTLYAVNQRFNVNDNDTILALSELSFDLSVYDIFGLLAVGGKVIFPHQNRIKDISHWGQLINDYKISIWDTTPQLASLLIEEIKNYSLINRLRLFLLSGDYIPVNLPGEIKKYLPNAKVISLGGATEGSIWSIWYEITKDLSQLDSIPYGLAMPNQNMYILDTTNKLCPIGAIGEIHIGGIGVALNYWNDKEKTKASFIEHAELGRLYKTGDLGRWHPDGYIEFMGRNDSQIKLRGYRVELSEIEHVLNSYPDIKQSIVTVHAHPGHNEKITSYLIGYYVSKTKLNQDAILAFLNYRLPEYMIPNVLVHMDRLPITANGKLDINALPNYIPNNINQYIAPETELEKKICSIFAEILNVHKDELGIKDDFFRLGGNSILAIKLVNKLNHIFNANIDLSAIFKYRNIYELSQNLDRTSLNTAKITKYLNLKTEEYKLSFAQERLWFINKFNQMNTAYNVPLIFKLSPTCNIKILLISIKNLVQRHEILRTMFKEDSHGDVFQLVTKTDLNIVEKQVKSKIKLHEHMYSNISYIFKLDEELPIKVFHYKYNKDHYLSIIIHHIAFDGWSADILVRDLLRYYEYNQKLADNEVARLDLPKLDIQYKDFALWQRAYLTGDFLNSQLAYWKNKLTGYERLNLPTDKVRPATFDYEGKTYHFTLELDLSQHLRKTARELNISLYNLLLSGFYLLLSTFSNQKDIILGTLLSNRHYSQIENLVGFFVNILVLRKQINVEDRIITYIKQVCDEALEAQLHQDLPFEKLVEELDTNKDPSRHPIIQVIFGVQHFGAGYENLFTNYDFGYANQTAKFDLTLLIDDKNEQLIGTLEYATNLFDEDTIKNYFETYKIILKQLSMLNTNTSMNKKIKDIYYISPATYKKLITDYNNSQKTYVPDKTIHQLFEEQVTKTPDNTAIICGNLKLSYNELNKKANQLAYYIRKHAHIKPDDLVALCLNKDEHMLIAILAVLKSGGAYIPIDTNYPEERIEYILADTGTNVVLSNQINHDRLTSIAKTLKQQEFAVLAIDNPMLQKKVSKEKEVNPQINVNHTNLAYVIYTSGTTGKPKGVLQPHINLVHLFTTTHSTFKFNPEDVWTLFHSYAFDFSVWEIFGALIYGGKLVIPDYEETKDLYMFYKLCKKQKVTVLNQTPSAFFQLMEIIIHKGKLNHLRYIIFGGESLNISQLKQWFSEYEDCSPKLINMYGITETTVHVTYKEITKNDINYDSHIGKVIPEKKAYILDNRLNLLPIGAIGELYIGGAGLANGYLNLPDLTANAFVPNIYQTEEEKQQNKNMRLYKTGDLVRWLSEGSLEYIGRNDTQIKIRGYRIELSEIEHVLNSYPNITQSIVLALDKGNNHKYLVGYYVKSLDIRKKDVNSYINNWKNLYDATYFKLDINNYKENFIGWNSSYTGETIDTQHMLEWRDETIKKLKSLNSKRILEIGSGSGLLLFNLIDKCEHYYATDFSSPVIKYIQKVINNFEYQEKVTTIKCKADRLPFEILKNNFDTVILNSVVQYFPTLDYLEKMLFKVIDNMCPLGQVFIGDIRDYRLLDCFYYSILKFKNVNVNLAEIDHYKVRDKELLIAPAYFIYLQQINPYISHIELLPKLGSTTNEMNCYRYDVVLHINKTNEITKYKLIDSAKFVKTLNIKEYLRNKNSEYIYIKYPNERIAQDYTEYKKLDNQECDLGIKVKQILNLSKLSSIMTEHNYKAKFYLDESNPLYINIIGYKGFRVEDLIIGYNNIKVSKSATANNPVYNTKLFENQYNEALMKYLETKLPDYMIPTYLVRLNKFPLTINGKLDYKSLPKPEFTISDNYISPRNDVDRKLCEMFAGVLGVPTAKVGIKSDFFKLGGNSLLAIKLLANINNHFDCKLKLTNIFVSRTIEKITQLILKSQSKFELITHLNNTIDKLNLFMIHPGSSGAEVYIPLAHKLSNYSCYGVNNYNLYHKKKIDHIGQLASFYLSAINKIRKATGQEQSPYLLLGWSLGAQIATEIAYILEQNGYKDIWIVAIDGPIADAKIAYYLSRLKINEKLLNDFFLKEEYLEEYASKVLANFKYDIKLAQQRIVSQLNYTKTLVFKAIQKDSRKFISNYELLNSYEVGILYNNMDKITNLNNIKLVKLEDVNHSNIITQDILIAHDISLWHKGALNV